MLVMWRERLCLVHLNSKENAMSLDMNMFIENQIILPRLPEHFSKMSDEEAIYKHFMRHLQAVPTSKVSIKVLSSIQFTADFLGYSDAHVTKVLVDLGLRAPREALPAEFLDYTDIAIPRGYWAAGGASLAVLALADHWRKIGEDPFVSVKRVFPLPANDLHVVV